eukprot:3890713-Heterocapsa_arctica.AAC.1
MSSLSTSRCNFLSMTSINSPISASVGDFPIRAVDDLDQVVVALDVVQRGLVDVLEQGVL